MIAVEINPPSGYAEGWDLFEVYSDGHPPWELQRDDEAKVFGDDSDAWKHVVRLAAAGSPTHVQTLAFLARHSIEELVNITHYLYLEA